MGDYVKKRTPKRKTPRPTSPRKTTTRRTFRRNSRLEFWRKNYDPRYLDSSDWLLYRKNHNPFRHRSHRWRRYERGFLLGRTLFPRPPIPTLKW